MTPSVVGKGMTQIQTQVVERMIRTIRTMVETMIPEMMIPEMM